MDNTRINLFSQNLHPQNTPAELFKLFKLNYTTKYAYSAPNMKKKIGTYNNINTSGNLTWGGDGIQRGQ